MSTVLPSQTTAAAQPPRKISNRKDPGMSRIGLTAAAAFVASVWLANYFVSHIGTQFDPLGPHVIDVGFDLHAPSGVLVVGVAFTLRDVVQRTLGRSAVVLCILLGAALSYLIAPGLAVASAVAFLASELADMGVYTPLSKRTWAGAVAVSNTVGAVVDSFLFLTIAFGSLEFFWPQVLGKSWMTLVAVALLAAAGRRRAVLVGNA